ncbi:MAG: hypothetical protein EZS28_026613 [Streblomastix strix]|uniref:Uncharacterized protein n=3 Tax=Streblomastix strix TaxID=222440 RepID=A0A5J4V6A3_9EUKA|nr:MAG: hypothetical protein EZS28_026613 [Streblomastix strix]
MVKIEIIFGYVEADEGEQDNIGLFIFDPIQYKLVVNEGQSEDQELLDEVIELRDEVNIGIEDVYQEDVELLNEKINNQEEEEDQEDDQNDGIRQRDKVDKVGTAILQQNGTCGSNYEIQRIKFKERVLELNLGV